MKPKILIVDDEKPLRDTLTRWFARDYECLTAPDAEAALAFVRGTPDLALLITDMKMPGTSGADLVREAKAIAPDLPAIMLTAYGTVDLAVEVMKCGAVDFFQKPITDLKSFELRVAAALRTAALEREVASLKGQLASELEDFTGKSPAMEKVYRLIRQVAPTDATVLIEGPSGSGKELTARALHSLSKRADGPFIAVECAAISKDLLESELFGYAPGTFTGQNREGKAGCFENADGGTLFLDEIGEIDLATQVALLRVLESKKVRRLGSSEEKPVDFRLVAATNRDLAAMVREKTFREDLYYRLKVIPIHTPALRDHREDIAALVARFVGEYSKKYGGRVQGIEAAALKRLESYDWPGNVRELRNVVERSVVLAVGERITLSDLPEELTTSAPGDAVGAPTPAEGETVPPTPEAPTSLAETEKQQILAALDKCGGNKSKAAELLGISRRTLHRKLNEWNLK